MSIITMRCADENMDEREFEPTGEGDYVCTSCGWYQHSAEAGAAELCNSAIWHDKDEYDRYAAIARSGGHKVPDEPTRFEEN